MAARVHGAQIRLRRACAQEQLSRRAGASASFRPVGGDREGDAAVGERLIVSRRTSSSARAWQVPRWANLELCRARRARASLVLSGEDAVADAVRRRDSTTSPTPDPVGAALLADVDRHSGKQSRVLDEAARTAVG